MWVQSLSDHAPLDFVFSDRQKNVPVNQLNPIPSNICKTDEFKGMVQCMVDKLDFQSIKIEEQLRIYNNVLREAGRLVRDSKLFKDPKNPESMRLVFSSMARAIWGQDLRLARRVLSSSSIATYYIQVVGKQVSAVDPMAFEAEYNRIHLADKNSAIRRLQILHNATETMNVRKQLRSQIQAAARQRSLHWPSHKHLRLAGVRSLDGVASSPQDIQDELKREWGPIYSEKPCDRDAAVKLLGMYRRRHSDSFLFSGVSLPGEESYIQFIKKC